MLPHQRLAAGSLALVAGSLASGTVLFSALEGWSVVDAFYFTGITLATIGYGDLAPSMAATKLLALGFGALGYLVPIALAAGLVLRSRRSRALAEAR